MRSHAWVVLALAVAIAGAAAAPASADFRYTVIPFDTSGTITITWHGDPAGGCAAAGLCAYRGTTTYPPARHGSFETLWEGRDLIGTDGEIDLPGRATTRVTRDVPGGDPAVCVDRGHGTFFPLDIEHAYRDRYSVGVVADLYPGAIASGRCAGPTLADVDGSLPSAVFRLARIQRPGTRVDLGGRFPFHAGPLAGEVVSTLALRSRRSRTKVEHDGGGSGPGERTVFVDLTYAVKRLRGTVRAGFRATDRGCAAIDACGATGQQRYTLAADRGRLEIFGAVPWHRRGKPTLRQALGRLDGHGFLFGYTELPERGLGETITSFALPGAPECRDRLDPTTAPQLSLDAHHGELTVRFGYGADESTGESFDDVLIGRCPGPTQAQVFGTPPLARTKLPLSVLTHKRLELLLRSAGSFSRHGYSGTRGARLEASLRRTHVRVSVGSSEGGGSIAVIRGSPTVFTQRP